MKRQTVLSGAVWLMLSAALAKLLGAGFRIPLTAMLGGSGMGYFSCAYGLFLPVFALSVTGMNTAAAALTAQALARGDTARVSGIARTAVRLFGGVGLAGSVLLGLFAKPLCGLVLHNPQAAPAVVLLAPAVWFCCMSAVLRGLYEGHQQMIPTAVSQVAEGIGRVGFGLLFAEAAMRNPSAAGRFFSADLPPEAIGAAAAVFGVMLSAALGTLTLMLFPRRMRTAPAAGIAQPEQMREIRRALIALLIPVAAASLVTNLTTLVDLATAMRTLSAGMLRTPAAYGLSADAAAAEADALANFYYGSYSGLAMTVFNLIPAVTNMLGKAVLPAFAAQNAGNDRVQMQRHAEDVMRRTAFLAVPAGLGVSVLAGPILRLLFPARALEVQIAAPALSVLGIAVIFTALSCPLFSMMQASGYAGDPVAGMLCGAGLKLIGNLLLIPRFGLCGAALSTLLCYFSVLTGSWYLFTRRTGLRLPFRRIFSGACTGGICCAWTARHLCFRLMPVLPRTALLLSIAAGAAVYLPVCLLLTKKNRCS